MASADLPIHLVESAPDGDDAGLQRVVESMIPVVLKTSCPA
jgi:hypothetical protein